MTIILDFLKWYYVDFLIFEGMDFGGFIIPKTFFLIIGLFISLILFIVTLDFFVRILKGLKNFLGKFIEIKHVD